MRLVFWLLVSLAPMHAAEWLVVEGAQSPDMRLSVAVYPQKTEFIDEADGSVLLIDAKRDKIIGPLEEVDSTGGTWGKTDENVQCEWSKDSQLLAVNFRVGRLMHSCQLYRIDGRLAVPLKVPDPRSHPKGRILDELEYSANPGAVVHLGGDGAIVVTHYGFMPKAGRGNEDYSRFAIKGFEAPGDFLNFVHRLDENGELKLIDVTAGE